MNPVISYLPIVIFASLIAITKHQFVAFAVSLVVVAAVLTKVGYTSVFGIPVWLMLCCAQLLLTLAVVSSVPASAKKAPEVSAFLKGALVMSIFLLIWFGMRSKDPLAAWGVVVFWYCVSLLWMGPILSTTTWAFALALLVGFIIFVLIFPFRHWPFVLEVAGVVGFVLVLKDLTSIKQI